MFQVAKDVLWRRQCVYFDKVSSTRNSPLGLDGLAFQLDHPIGEIPRRHTTVDERKSGLVHGSGERQCEGLRYRRMNYQL